MKSEKTDNDYVEYCLKLAKDNTQIETDIDRKCWLIKVNEISIDGGDRNIVDVDKVKPEEVFENCVVYHFQNEDNAHNFLDQKRVQLAVYSVTGKVLDIVNIKNFYRENANVKWHHGSNSLPQKTWQDVAKLLIVLH